jgi:hypothetical protein
MEPVVLPEAQALGLDTKIILLLSPVTRIQLLQELAQQQVPVTEATLISAPQPL